MSDKMREAFEAEYPPPENAAFNGDVYVAPLPAEGMTAYNVRWDAWKRAWQAARTVPEKVECGCGDIYPASQFMCANCLAAVGAADELRRVDEAQSVPVVGEPDCYDAGLLNDFGGGNVEWWQDYIRAELARAHDFYASQWPSSIPSTELATLREKAAMVDELRKDAERLQWMIDETAILMYSVGIDRTLCRVEWPLTGYVQDAFYPSERAAIDAAIAQEPRHD